MKIRQLKILLAALALCGAFAARGGAAEPGGGTATAIFAGGCFWSMQKLFDHVAGVVSTTVGYTGGRKKNPTYEEVSYTDTGHLEANQL